MKACMLTVALSLLSLSAPAQATNTSCKTNTGVNASVIINADAYRSLQPNDYIRAYSSERCVGETLIASSEATAYALTVWGEDPFDLADGGIPNGELIKLTLEKPATTLQLNTEGVFADNLQFQPDRLYNITAAEFDTTTTRLMQELLDNLALVEAELDSASVADSIIIATQQSQIDALNLENADLQADKAALEQTVADQLANIQDLQFQLAAANTRADSLQNVIDTFPDVSELQAENDRLTAENAALRAEIAQVNADLVVALDRLTRIYYVVMQNKNRYKDICAVIPEC